MRNLTQEDIDTLKYFWEDRGDIEIYCRLPEIEDTLRKDKPEVLKAFYDYKASIRIMDAVIRDLKL